MNPTNHGLRIRTLGFGLVVESKELYELNELNKPNEPIEAARHADALVILTDWPEFRDLDYRRIKGLLASPNIVDGKNLLESDRVRSLGFKYKGMGRS